MGRPGKVTRYNETRVEFATGSRIAALPGREETIRGFQGVHLLILDEAARIPDALYRSVRGSGCRSQTTRICPGDRPGSTSYGTVAASSRQPPYTNSPLQRRAVALQGWLFRAPHRRLPEYTSNMSSAAALDRVFDSFWKCFTPQVARRIVRLRDGLIESDLEVG